VILPLIALFERPLPLPASIGEPVLRGGAAMGNAAHGEQA
jgi:hypothetical protein